MSLKKVSSVLLGVAILTPTLSYGAESSSPTVLSQEATLLDVTVPISMPISVDNIGNITVANNLEVINNSYGPIQISDVNVTPKGGWALSDFDKDYSSSVVGSKEFGFKVDGVESDSNGNIAISKVINGEDKLPISYDSTVAPQKESIVNSNIADVVLTIDWHDEIELPGVTLNDGSWSRNVDINNYEVAKEGDYIKDENGNYVYQGNAEYVAIPNEINGEKVTSLKDMFWGKTNLKGVIIPDGIVSMENTFVDCVNLQEIAYLPNSVTTMMSTFQGCTSLKSVPVKLPENLKLGTNAFFKCSSLTKAPILPEGLRSMYGMFNASGITSITIPSTVTELGYAFKDCVNLEGDLVIPNSVDSTLGVLDGTVKPITLKYTSGWLALGNLVVPSNVTLQEIN